MASISSTGIGSGLDVTSIVSQLVALEKQPLKTLELKATNVNNQISAMGDIQSQFSTLADTATKLSAADAWSARTSSSSNTTAATITTTNTAPATSFTLDVDALAQKQSVSSSTYASGALVGPGTMTFRLGTWTTPSSGSDAAVIAANATLATKQGVLTTATADKVLKDAALATSNTALAAADAALVAPTAASTAANSLLAMSNAALAAATQVSNTSNAQLTASDAALTNATSAKTTADAALVTANTNLAGAPGAVTTANANLATALAAKVSATNASNSANGSLVAADAVVASATSSYNTANDSSTVALAADQNAKAALAGSGLGTDGANGQAYSVAYSAWVDAVAANDHATPASIDAENLALANLSVKRSALDATQLAAANAITAGADATDASSLKGAAIAAAATLTTATSNRASALTTANAATATLLTATDDHANAFAAVTAANTALATATSAQAAAAAAVATATSNLTSATAAQTAAATVASQATTALGTATSDQATAQTNANAATAALAPYAAARATAQGTQTTAASDAATASATVATAASDVTTATALRDAALTTATSALPTFTTAAGSLDVAINVTSTDTLASLVVKINASGAGVVASVFKDGSNERLQLTSRSTGAAAGFRVQVTDTGDGVNTDNNGLSKLAFDPQTGSYGIASSGISTRYGQDARVRIDGVAATSSTNTFVDNKPGVTITIKAATTTGYGTATESKSPATLSVSEDVTVAVKNVNDFITAYNALNKTLSDLTKYDAGTKTASLFQADSTILGMQSILRNIQGSVSTGSVYQHLSDVGIERLKDGSLSMNTSKLGVAANNGTELQKLFVTDNGSAATNGFALKFATMGKGILASGGAVTNKSKALSDALARNAKDQTKVNDRATAVEARLRKTYSALDTKMASLTALNSYVAQQVTTWNKSSA